MYLKDQKLELRLEYAQLRVLISTDTPRTAVASWVTNQNMKALVIALVFAACSCAAGKPLTGGIKWDHSWTDGGAGEYHHLAPVRGLKCAVGGWFCGRIELGRYPAMHEPGNAFLPWLSLCTSSWKLNSWTSQVNGLVFDARVCVGGKVVGTASKSTGL